MQRTQFKAKSFIWLNVVMVGYLYLNYKANDWHGRPAYPMIDWKSTKSHCYVGVAWLLASVGFYISLKISQGYARVLDAIEYKKEKDE